jgi:hypothetical protein
MRTLRNSPGGRWLAGVASALLLLGATAQAAVIDGLVAYWNFDQSNFQDFLGTYHGTAEPAGTTIAFEDGPGSVFGKAIRLDGASQEVIVTGGAPDDLAFAGRSMSVAGWFKVNAFDTAWQCLIAKGEGTNWRVHRRDPGTTLTCSMGLGEAGVGGPNVSDGKWHHFAAIADTNAGMFLYVDGVLAESTTTRPVLASNGQRVRIGENPDAQGREWNGWIDDMAIWSRPLTASEISELSVAPLSQLIGGGGGLVVRQPTADAASFSVDVVDLPPAVSAPGTVKTVLDGTSITPVVSKAGSVTKVSYNIFTAQNQFFLSGSQHTLVLTIDDTTGKSYTNNLSFTVAPYPTIPVDYKLAAAASTDGFGLRFHQLPLNVLRAPGTDNATGSGEHQLAGGYVQRIAPDLKGTPWPNVAYGGGISNEIAVINYEQTGNNINATGDQPDNFNTVEPAGSGGLYGNLPFPNIPGEDVSLANWLDYFSMEATTYLRLKRGLYRMGVNSDDGFKVSCGLGVRDIYGITIGELSGGRGAGDSIFDFVVLEDGDYPFRLMYYEGNGGANCEWFSVDLTTGTKYLINDASQPNAIKGFQTGTGRAHIRSLVPGNGFNGVQPIPTVKVEIADGRTTASAVQLWVDGVKVADGVKSGGVTTASFTPAAAYGFGTDHSGSIVWTESTTPATTRTNNFTFRIEPQSPNTLPPNSYWIEAEDYDYNSGQTVAAASTMPYGGGAYSNLIGKVGVDYFDNETGQWSGTAFTDGVVGYRGDNRGTNNPATAMLCNPAWVGGGEQYATNRPGPFRMTANFKLGWVGGDNWWNYTRTIPAGIYRAYSAQSQGGPGDQITSTLHWVTSGAGTSNQVLRTLGVFRGIGSTGWSQNILATLRTANSDTAPMAAVKLPGGPVTLRWQGGGGDHDWFVFAPATGVPPVLSGPTPPTDLTVRRDAALTWTIEDFNQKVVTNTIKLMFDGVDVSTSLQISKAGDITTIVYDPPELLDLGRKYPYELSFSDDATPAAVQQQSGTVVAYYLPSTPAGGFLIEAEDFNYDGGKALPIASTMPYLGNAYTNLAAVMGIDYMRGDVVNDGNNYRYLETNNVPMGGNFDTNTLDRIRAQDAGGVTTWQVTNNYAIGWGGGNVQWYNYTRTIPANKYQVWLSGSYDGRGANQVAGWLEKVTSGATTTNQTVEYLGRFNSPGSGGWGNNTLVPLVNTNTLLTAEIDLGGETTLRYNCTSGDTDYLMLIPLGAALPRIDKISVNAQGQVVIEWTGAGTVQKASTLPAASWTDVPGSSPLTVPPPASGQEYYRLKQ